MISDLTRGHLKLDFSSSYIVMDYKRFNYNTSDYISFCPLIASLRVGYLKAVSIISCW